MRGLVRGRRRPLPDRDGVRHAQREGRDRGGTGRRAGASDRGLADRRRSQRPHALGSDGRGVLGLDRARAPARRGDQLLARRRGDASLAGGARARGHGCPCGAIRTPACRMRSGATRSRPRRPPRCCASSPRAASSTRVGGCCGTTPEHIAAIAEAVSGLPPREVPAPRPLPRFAGLEPFAVEADTGFVMVGRAHERDGLGALPPADRGGRLHGRGRRRAGAGARRRERARREHGRGHARLRGGDDALPQPDRDRARDRAHADHGRQLALVGDPGRAALPPGQGHRELDLAQGGRGGLPRQGARDRAASAPRSS